MLWLLSGVEFTFAFDESLGIGVSFGAEVVPGVMPCVAVVEVTGAGVDSGITTGVVVVLALGLASVSELLRLQATKAKGKLTDRRAMKSLFLVDFIDVLSLVRLNTVGLIYLCLHIYSVKTLPSPWGLHPMIICFR